MAKKITELPALTTGVAEDDILAIVDDPNGSAVTKKVSVLDLVGITHTVNVRQAPYSAVGDGVADDTSAFLSAISDAGANSLIYIPPGIYKISSTLTLPTHRMHLLGAGGHATRLLFAPTADDTLLAVDGSSTLLFQGSISNLALWSNDSTYTKVALDIVDTSGWRFENIIVGGSVAVGGSSFWSGGTGSIGVQVRGRDAGVVRSLFDYADRPLLITDNPNHSIDIDHWHFQDLYLGANANPCVEVASGVNVTDVVFDGYNPWVLGTYGFYWNDTATAQIGQDLTIMNVGTEQGTDGNAYGFYISHNYNFHNLRIINSAVGTDRNFGYFRKITGLHIEDCLYSSTSKIALNVDSTVFMLRGFGNFWQAGSTLTISGQELVWSSPKYPNSAALPPNFIYQNSTATDHNLRTSQALTSPNTTVAQDATVEVGDGTSLGFLHVVTSENVGAIYFLRGSTNTVAEVADPDSHFTITKDTATQYNIYWDAGSSRFVLQNKRTGSKNIRFVLIGAHPI